MNDDHLLLCAVEEGLRRRPDVESLRVSGDVISVQLKNGEKHQVTLERVPDPPDLGKELEHITLFLLEVVRDQMKHSDTVTLCRNVEQLLTDIVKIRIKFGLAPISLDKLRHPKDRGRDGR